MALDSSSHLVLARKWRPERFAELVGQEHVTRTLGQALQSGRIAHAFLFTGIRGVGKTTAARILARCLNCEKGPTPEPCGQCAACIEIREGRALDVSEIDGATYRKIDDARAIIENLSYRPARDRFKIYIIDEAHQLTDQAFNALLKTLEEPPAHVKFILATTEPQKMPETILSRLQRYDFRRIPLATTLARLKELADREGVELDESAARLLAREAGGSMRDAERTLETAIASLGNKITEGAVAASLGVAGRGAVFKLTEAILDKDAAGALASVREQHRRGANLESLGRDLLETLRDLAVAKLPQTGDLNPLDDLPDHEAAELRRIAERPSSRDLMRLFKLMADAQEQIVRSPYPDLLLEMVVVRMAMLAPVMDADDLMRALGKAGTPPSAVPGASGSGASGSTVRAETRVPQAGASAPTGARRMRVEGEVKADAPRRVAAAPASASAATESGTSAAPGRAPVSPSGADLPELREHIRMRRAALAGFMEQGAGLALDGDVVRILPRNDIYIRYLSDNRASIAELASELYGRRLRVEVSVSGPATPASPPADAAQAGTAGTQSRPSGIDAPSDSVPRAAQSAGGPTSEDGRTADSLFPAAGSALSSDRQALYADPVVRRIFEDLQGRLVDVRKRPAAVPTEPAAKTSLTEMEDASPHAGRSSSEE